MGNTTKPLRKTRPQHHADECPDCKGSGGSFENDEDGKFFVECEGCENSGSVTQCDRCDEPMSLPQAELYGYVCGPCRADAERSDAAAEMLRIMRRTA